MFRSGDLLQISQQCGAFMHDLGHANGYHDSWLEIQAGVVVMIIADAYEHLQHKTVLRVFHPALGACILRFHDDEEARGFVRHA